MKLSIERILNDGPKLGEISQMQLPAKVSYAIAKNIGKLEEELKVYNGEREKLIEKYSIKDEEGKTLIGENSQIKIQDKHLASWNKDIREILSIETEIDIHMFSINDLTGFNISPALSARDVYCTIPSLSIKKEAGKGIKSYLGEPALVPCSSTQNCFATACFSSDKI